MATTLHRPSLPDKSALNYVDALIDACIDAFEKFQDDAMALNYMGVSGKYRPIVLESERYRIETRKLKADKVLEEIEEIEEISKALKTDMPKEGGYDIRNPKSAEAFQKDQKEMVTARLKVASIRRELFSVGREEDKEEADALNIFFIPLTAEEFAAMLTVEIHEGEEDIKLEKDETKAGPEEASGTTHNDTSPLPFYHDKAGNIVQAPRNKS
jgi:hypothetical protein